ncbi:MAG: bifunctional riboflavin kinase/FAD synthetase, partial [Planctomycetia bacterium]|nr:bifunctional riboflavin kinase/FAD synthetase [Planctomycetia bacterium]
MELIYNLQGVSGALPGAVVSVGNFDGLHIGHAKIVKDIVRRARAAKAPSATLTSHPHSLAIVAPGRAPPLLLAFDEKLRLLERMGLDAVVCPQQGKSVLGLSPEKFVKDILLGVIGASCIIEGRGFRFGKGRVGTLRTLRALGRRHGFDVQIIEAVKVGGRIVSSTRIRRLIRGGRMREAARCMGRPFTYVGSVMRGHDRGARMG